MTHKNSLAFAARLVLPPKTSEGETGITGSAGRKWILCRLDAILATIGFIAGLAYAHPIAAEELQVWRHAIVEAKADAGFVLMPGQPEVASKHGLRVEYVQMKGDALALKALLAGDVDSFEGSPGGAIIAAARGADVKVVGCYWPGLSYGLFTSDKITDVEQLKGAVFAISSPGSLPDLLVRSILEERGIPVTEVRFAAMGGDADRYRALTAGIIGAAALSTEFAPLAAKNGLKMLVDGHKELPSYLRLCTYMSGAALKRHRDAAVNFVAAQMDGIRYAEQHRSETVALARTTLTLSGDDARPVYVYDQAVNNKLIDPSMPLPVENLIWMEQLLLKTGNLSESFDVSKMVDTTIRADAFARTTVK
ncbi:MAG: ABC transporter substrate-binding protein [Methylocella sp.]